MKYVIAGGQVLAWLVLYALCASVQADTNLAWICADSTREGQSVSNCSVQRWDYADQALIASGTAWGNSVWRTAGTATGSALACTLDIAPGSTGAVCPDTSYSGERYLPIAQLARSPAPPPPPPPPPPTDPYVAKTPTCWPSDIGGSGSEMRYDTVPRGGNVLTQDAVIVWWCSDGYTYHSWSVGGRLTNALPRLSTIQDGIRALIGGDRAALDTTWRAGIDRPHTDAELAVVNELRSLIGREPLVYVVAPNGTQASRPVNLLTDGVLASGGGRRVQVGVECDCTDPALRLLSGSTLRCSVADQPNFGTSAVLPANAVAVCRRQQ